MAAAFAYKEPDNIATAFSFMFAKVKHTIASKLTTQAPEPIVDQVNCTNTPEDKVAAYFENYFHTHPLSQQDRKNLAFAKKQKFLTMRRNVNARHSRAKK